MRAHTYTHTCIWATGTVCPDSCFRCPFLIKCQSTSPSHILTNEKRMSAVMIIKWKKCMVCGLECTYSKRYCWVTPYHTHRHTHNSLIRASLWLDSCYCDMAFRAKLRLPSLYVFQNVSFCTCLKGQINMTKSQQQFNIMCWSFKFNTWMQDLLCRFFFTLMFCFLGEERISFCSLFALK